MFVVFSSIALKSTRSSPLATILPKILFPSTAKTTAENRRQFSSPDSNMEKPNTIYQFHALDIDGNDVNLDKYRGKVVMIMNVASECGYTKVNYGQGRELLEKYKDQGFCIAAFPCNQFNNEEPGTNEQIKEFINGKWNFYPDLYAKINVNGKEAHPLWNFLKEEQHGTIIDAIKWNFTKFLVNKEGQVIARYAPNVEPKQIEPDIRKCLGIGER